MNDLFRELAQEPYEPRGILHSEMAFILHVVRKLDIQVIIESGRARGQSTYILAKYLPDVLIHSVELRNTPDEPFARARLEGFENVTLHNGDGVKLVPELCATGETEGCRMAILCDGPKGEAAVSILEHCFRYRRVRVGFIHDMRRLDHGAPSPHRACAVARLPYHRFTDDPALVAGTSWMDAGIAEAGGPCGPQHEAVFGSYGPTIGAFFNIKQQTAGI